MNQGWIKLFRKFLEWEWYDDKNAKALFIHLLLKCNYEEKKWHGQTVLPGQIVIGVGSFGEEIGLTYQQTRTSLEKLESTGEITSKTTNRYTLITLCHWEDYQGGNERLNEQITNKQRTDNEQITTTKEYKNIKKERSIEDTPRTKMQKFLLSVEEKNDDFLKLIEILIGKGMNKDFATSEIAKFARYWAERTKNGQKQRWETQKTFEVNRRLATWFENASKWGKTEKKQADLSSVMF